MSDAYKIIDPIEQYEMIDLEGVKRMTGLEEIEIFKLIDSGIMCKPTKIDLQIWHPYRLFKVRPSSAEMLRLCLKALPNKED